MDYLQGLNDQQKTAVTTIDGPVMIVAGPGSGKTRVLTHRIAYLIGTLGVRPFKILAVTFTNKAAREMGNRVASLVGENTRGLTLGTFHSICAKILRIEACSQDLALPFDSKYVIYDRDDQEKIIKQIQQAHNKLETREKPPQNKTNNKSKKDQSQELIDCSPSKILSEISKTKNQLASPDQLPDNEDINKEFKTIYEKYQEILKNNNALDFDDLLLWSNYILSKSSKIRDKYADRYTYILVDEFQDTNLVQYELIRNLASKHRNLFVIGDTDQSIYSWRGADSRNTERLQRDFQDIKILLLEKNYRSTQIILDAASAVIKKNPNRIEKELSAHRKEEGKISIKHAISKEVEAEYVIENIKKLAAKEPNLKEFAIMYRTNAQSGVFENVLKRKDVNINYQIVGAQKFYGRKEVKDIIAYFRLIYNPSDDISLVRIINTPSRGIGDKSLDHLKEEAHRQQLSIAKMLIGFDQTTLDGLLREKNIKSKPREGIINFCEILKKWINKANESKPIELMDLILEQTQFKDKLDDGTKEGNERWEYIMELRRIVSQFEDLDDLLQQVALVSDQDTLKSEANAITLLTFHAAKGLEFSNVFITGLNEGLIPHRRSIEDSEQNPETLQEERRLLYVGMTRAKDRLYLSYAFDEEKYKRELHSNGYREQSNFFDEMPESRFLLEIRKFLNNKNLPQRANTNDRQRLPSQDYDKKRYIQNSHDKRDQKPAIQQKFAPSMRVEHPVWGEGMVLNSRIQDDDEIVDVFFANLGLKHLSASLARLEIKS